MNGDRWTKVIFLGSVGVGKTTLMTRMSENRFDPDTHPTAAAAFCQWKPEGTDGLVIQFWDTSGMERFRSINRIYYRQAVAAIIVFDLTDARTFAEVDNWKKDFDHENTLSHAVVILVGNKCDLGEKCNVTEEDARTWADDNAAQYFAVSAMTGEGVIELLDGLVRTIPRRTVKGGKSLSLVLDEQQSATSPKHCC
jgi:small GTP-binding protein